MGEGEERCLIEGCEEPAVKLVNRSFLPYIQALKLKLKEEHTDKITLCRKHYRMVKEAREAYMRF